MLNKGTAICAARRLTEGPDGVDRHELVLVGAGATVEAEGDEQESHANELGGGILLVAAVWATGGRFFLVPETKKRGTAFRIERRRTHEGR